MDSAMLDFEKLLSTSRQRQWGKANSSRRLVLLANWKLESEFRRLLARGGPERAWQPASEAAPMPPTTHVLQQEIQIPLETVLRNPQARFRAPNGEMWRLFPDGTWAWERELLKLASQYTCPMTGHAWRYLDEFAWAWESELSGMSAGRRSTSDRRHLDENVGCSRHVEIVSS